jgi:vacuolar-type H+-ATPase subunit E/Vma4
MVTIEEKIKLFYKLLNQSMDNKLTEDLKELEDSHEIKLNESKTMVDKEAKEIEEKALKRAEVKRAESTSKSKVIIKKDIMALKEKYYHLFMAKFENYIKEFGGTDQYKDYLSKIMPKLSEEIKNCGKCDTVIYVTKNDKEKYGGFIKKEISKNGCKVELKTSEDIMGGLIAELPEKNIKIDMSVDSVLEDNKTYIMQTVFEALEAGDYNV